MQPSRRAGHPRGADDVADRQPAGLLEGARAARRGAPARDRAPAQGPGRGDPRPLLPGRGDPGDRRPRRRLAAALAAGGRHEGEGDRLLRGALHGRDGQDPEPRQAGAAPRPRCRLLALRPVPAGAVRALARAVPRPQGGQLHQLLGGREGALGRHLHLVQRGEGGAELPARDADRLRPGPAPGRVGEQEDGAGPGAVAGLLHRARAVHRAAAHQAESAPSAGEAHRASGVRGERARHRGLRRLDPGPAREVRRRASSSRPRSESST